MFIAAVKASPCQRPARWVDLPRRETSVADGRLSPREAQLLIYVARWQPVTVREAAAGWAAPRGLARTTCLTLLERLRRKGRVTRQRIDGAYCYAVVGRAEEAVDTVIASFCDDTLGGWLTPLVRHLRRRADLSDDERGQLNGLD